MQKNSGQKYSGQKNSGSYSLLQPENDPQQSLRIDAAQIRLKAGSWQEAFEKIALEAAAQTGLDAKNLAACLLSAERASPSGIGDGVALPHMTVKGAKTPFTLIATLSEPVSMDAVDGRPVDLIALLISPSKDGPYHLRRLARLSRALKDRMLRRSLREAQSLDEIRTNFESTLVSLAA